MKQYLLVITIIFLSHISFSQDIIKKKCGTSSYTITQKIKHPDLAERIYIHDNKIKSWIKNNRNNKDYIETITIPVVFHIIFKTKAENISNACILSQLDVLNEDYRKLNNDAIIIPDIFKSLAADCNVEFCLAQRDPNGNPTTGIIRKQTNVDMFSAENDDVKFSITGGDDIWDRDKYLNIWVCSLNSGIAGYSSYPGWSADIDGVVINYNVFGRIDNHNTKYNEGRTVTHEVGHWLSLYHLWGDIGEQCGDGECTCSDFCEDTPWQKAANYDCPVYPHYTCSDTSDMFMNYMDYTNDMCMHMFTNDQKLRMIATLNLERAPLINSDGCIPPVEKPTLDFTANYTEIPSGTSANFNAVTDGNFKQWLWLFNGAKPDTSNLKNPQNIYYYKPGKYTVTLIASNDNGMVRTSKINYIVVDSLGNPDDIKIKYQYYKNDSLKYFVNSNTITIDFGKRTYYNVKIKVYNILGQTIASFNQLGQKLSQAQQINIPPSLTNNIYFIKISTQSGNFYKRLMIFH